MSTVFRLRGPNGEWRWTNVRAAPLLNPDGSIRKWVGMNVDVSDRIKAEQARRESEAKYRALFESMDEGFVLADVLFDGDRATDVLYLALNPPAVRMMGQDCTALRMQQIQPGPGFGPDWLESLGQVARTGHPIRVQHYAKPLDAWFECHAFRVGPEDLPRIGVVFEDITARMRREAQQRAAAARDTFRVRLADALRRLADPMQIQSTAATLLGQHLGVARVAYKESEDEHVIVHVEYAHDVPAATGRYHLPDFGQNLFADLRAGRTLVVSDVNEATLTDAERAMYRSERVGAHITVPLIKDGTLIAVLSVQHPTPRAWTDDERTLVEEVAERTWDAVERARSEQALIEKDRRLRAALSAAHMGTWLWDVRTDTQVIDENLQQLMGVARVPSKGSLDQFLRAVAPEDRGLVRKAFARSVEDGSGLDLEFRVRSNGQVHWLRERGEVVRDPEGRALYVTGACVDITDRKAMEEELRLAARRKDEFLAVLSHELRNPLAPIRNSVYVLERAAPGGEQAVRARQIIDRQARHLTRLIEDLLDVTRIARGKVSLQRQRVDLNELVRKTAEDHRELFSQNGLEFEVVDTGHPLYLNADPTRVAQMIGNLLGNSAKFTPRGGRTTLSLETDAQGNARIRVRDNGMGVAPETLNHIFEPFVQADRTLHRSSGGLGLGLALVKGLAELHGGQAYAHSEGLGKGAEFVISLPLQEQPASLGPSMAAQDEPNRKLRVLIIEDNLDTAESLREVLALGGHEVALAYDGFEGVSLARQFKPHVIFCDIGLPGKNGLAIAREIRAEPELAHVALFAVSGYAQPEDVESAKQAGFDAHLSKPPTIAALERALASSVRHLG